MGILPTLAQGGVEALVELGGQIAGFALLVEGDGLADGVHNDLARFAPGHVFLELRADCRIHSAVHVFVQEFEEFFTFHTARPTRMSRG